MRRLALCLFSVLALCSDASALELPAVIADHMVIKREAPVPLWGWSKPGGNVTVEFADQEKMAVAGKNGKWLVTLDPMAASTKGRDLTIATINQQPVTIHDVLVGDVWHASGQSNMQMTLEKCTDIDKENLDFPAVRRLRVLHNAATEPLERIAGCLPWTPVTREIVDSTSATAYFFARNLYQETGVPQGIIDTAWNGKALEPFYAAKELGQLFPNEYDAMRSHPKFSSTEVKLKRRIPNSTEIMPFENHYGWIFNAKIAPLIPYAITGTIWYQGESNAGNKLAYANKLDYLIGTWRKAWNQGNFPFYYVQLNSNKPTDGTPADGKGFAGIIEGQRRALASGEIPNIGMAVIWDTGNPTNTTPKPGTREGGIMLHCPNKRDVGIRLALWALRDVHDRKSTVVCGPIYRSHEIRGNRVILSFDHVGSGLMVAEKRGFADPVPTPGRKLTNFAIAGEDRRFVWADAEIVGSTVVVSSPKVPEPKAVRFCFNSAPFRYFNFYNREGLPASPFIADGWYR